MEAGQPGVWKVAYRTLDSWALAERSRKVLKWPQHEESVFGLASINELWGIHYCIMDVLDFVFRF
jgi:hypothetical protein